MELLEKERIPDFVLSDPYSLLFFSVEKVGADTVESTPVFMVGGATISIYHGVKIKTTAIRAKARSVFLSMSC